MNLQTLGVGARISPVAGYQPYDYVEVLMRASGRPQSTVVHPNTGGLSQTCYFCAPAIRRYFYDPLFGS